MVILRTDLSPGSAVVTAAAGNVHFAADDWANPPGMCGGIKFYSTVHYSVIGYRDRILSERFGAFDELLDLDRSVENAVLRVEMQMAETAHTS